MDTAGAFLNCSLSHMVGVWALQKLLGFQEKRGSSKIEAESELAKKKHLIETQNWAALVRDSACAGPL